MRRTCSFSNSSEVSETFLRPRIPVLSILNSWLTILATDALSVTSSGSWIRDEISSRSLEYARISCQFALTLRDVEDASEIRSAYVYPQSSRRFALANVIVNSSLLSRFIEISSSAG